MPWTSPPSSAAGRSTRARCRADTALRGATPSPSDPFHPRLSRRIGRRDRSREGLPAVSRGVTASTCREFDSDTQVEPDARCLHQRTFVPTRSWRPRWSTALRGTASRWQKASSPAWPIASSPATRLHATRDAMRQPSASLPNCNTDGRADAPPRGSHERRRTIAYRRKCTCGVWTRPHLETLNRRSTAQRRRRSSVSTACARRRQIACETAKNKVIRSIAPSFGDDGRA